MGGGGQVMGGVAMKPVLSTVQKKQIDKLFTAGKKQTEIAEIMDIRYADVDNCVNRHKKAQRDQAKRDAKSKIVQLTCKSDVFVDTGKPMPPTHKSELKIIASKELAELACQQLGLKPPVCSLSERPRNINARGWVRVNGKWMADADVNITGRVRHMSAGSQL